MLVPSYSTNVNHWDTSAENTFALGLGGRYRFYGQYALIAEYIPVLEGYAAEFTGWGLGVEAKTGGHVFQIFLTNNYGLTPDQYLPGAENIQSNEFRIGFNIFRTFWL